MSKKCPLMGDCIEHGCAWFTHIAGQHPQSGEALDRWECAVTLLPMLMIETARHARDTAAQVSAANETNKQALRSAALGRATPELQRLIGVEHGGH
jgi:hypothetical protein